MKSQNRFVFSLSNEGHLQKAFDSRCWAFPVWKAQNESLIAKAMQNINAGDRCFFFVTQQALRREYSDEPRYFDLPAIVAKAPRECSLELSPVFGSGFQLQFEITPCLNRLRSVILPAAKRAHKLPSSWIALLHAQPRQVCLPVTNDGIPIFDAIWNSLVRGELFIEKRVHPKYLK